MRIAYIIAAMSLLCPARAEMLEGKVTDVHDGDTATVQVGKEIVKVRFHGIDAPELKQFGGADAQRYAASLILKKRVKVDVKDRDRYGRAVGVIWLADKDINATVVYAGYAWAYRQYSKDYVDREEAARRNKRGIWADPVAPWEYRKALRAK